MGVVRKVFSLATVLGIVGMLTICMLAIGCFHEDVRAFYARQVGTPRGVFGTHFVPLLASSEFAGFGRDNAKALTFILDQVSLAPGHSVLEIGYGTGEMMAYYVNRTTQADGTLDPDALIAGFDVSPPMYAAASARNADLVRDGKVHLYLADARVTPLPYASSSFVFKSDYDAFLDRVKAKARASAKAQAGDAGDHGDLPVHKFDLLVANNVLEYLEDPIETLENIKVLLKDSGSVLSCALTKKGRAKYVWWQKYIPRRYMDVAEHAEYFEEAGYGRALQIRDPSRKYSDVYCIWASVSSPDDDDGDDGDE